MRASLGAVAKRVLGICMAQTGTGLLLHRIRCARKGAVLVLGYHGVGRPGDYSGERVGPWVTGVNPEQFDRQVDWLSRRHNFASLESVINHVGGREQLRLRPVSVTFDDGYMNLYDNALPVLKRYSVPVTVFLTAGMVGKARQFLTWPQVREMHNNGIAFGAHTVSHPFLTRLPLQEAREEIVRSKAEIEEHIGYPINFFSYPHGSLNSSIVGLVAEAGFLGAVSTKYGVNGQRSNPFALDRVMIGDNEPFYMFLARMAGAFDIFHNVRMRNRMGRRILKPNVRA